MDHPLFSCPHPYHPGTIGPGPVPAARSPGGVIIGDPDRSGAAIAARLLLERTRLRPMILSARWRRSAPAPDVRVPPEKPALMRALHLRVAWEQERGA